MSFANFGIGIGALAQGLSSGIDTGAKLHGLMQQGKLRKAREAGMADAKTARQSAIDGLVQVGSTSNADNTMTMPTFNVGDQSYSDEASARKAAEGQVGSLDEFYIKVAAPKIYEEYLAIDPEKAEAWKAWNDAKEVKQGQKLWASAVMKANMGDFDGFGKDLVKAYNSRGYFDDGTQVKDWKTLKDDKGNITGAQLTFKGPDGKEYSQVINGMEDAYRMGAFMLSPENVFNTGWAEIQAAKKAQLEMAKEDRKFQRDVYRDDRKAANQSALQSQRDDAALERTVTGKQMDAANKSSAVNQKVELLKRNGFSDDWIAQNLPAILGIGEYKKAISPDDARLRLHEGRIKNDYSYARKSQAEQRAIIEQDMQMIYGSQPQQRSNPLSGGISGQGARPTGRVPMIYDTTTGKTVPYSR